MARSNTSSPNMSLIQNKVRPEKWKYLAPFVAPKAESTTFGKQDTLPSLPVPDLDHTIAKLKRSLRPLAHSEEELATTFKLVDDFANNGVGKMLHERLLERAKSTDHWLEEFWDDIAYLGYRETIMTNVSYYYGFSHHPSHLDPSPAARAAALTRSALLFRKNLKLGKQPVDMMKNAPMCMDTWRWTFDCCRIPGLQGLDWEISAAKSQDDGEKDAFIAVFRKNRVWKVPVTDPTTGKLLSTGDIQKQLEQIYKETTKTYPLVGVLSSADRDTWAKDYEHLTTSPQNAAVIEAIVSSAFVVCLDDTHPKNPFEMSRALFHGGIEGGELGNRWLDKPCQFIIFDNGEAGFMGEHAVMDGTPTVTLCDALLDALHHKTFDHGTPIPERQVPKPISMDWEVTPQMEKAIEAAQQSAHEVIARQDMRMLSTPYGRDRIKTYGYSPDAYAQLLVQLAYHRVLNNSPYKGKGYASGNDSGSGRKRIGGTYEASTTRGFFKGRTEAIRIVTDESMNWCDAMDDPSVSSEQRVELFKAATTRHKIDAADAGNAMGCDRHMFGMKNLVKKGEALHPLYSDPLYLRGCTWVISTSAIFSKHFTRGYGWGQVMPEGFGVAYMTGFKDRLEFTITSRRDQPNAEFVEQLKKASDDMEKLFEGQVKTPKSKL